MIKARQRTNEKHNLLYFNEILLGRKTIVNLLVGNTRILLAIESIQKFPGFSTDGRVLHGLEGFAKRLIFYL